MSSRSSSRMSPSARGLLPGLFLALAASFGVLTANNHWLLPSVDETGVRYLVTAPAIAAGEAPAVPIADWDAASAETGLEGQGKLVPILMAAGIRQGARAFVAGLWVMALAAGGVVLALCWSVGGVGGIPAAVLATLLLVASPLTVEAATVLDPGLVEAALVLALLGALTYRPDGALLHGILAALAWWSAPVGLGAVAAVLAWPVTRAGTWPVRTRRLVLGVLPPAVLVGAALRWPLLTPPAWHPARGSGLVGVAGLTRWAGFGLPGWAGVAVGAVLLLLLAVLVIREGRSAPKPKGPLAWTDPSAPDWLARSFRPAAALLLASTAVVALTGPAGASLTPPWLPVAWLLAAVAGAAAWRWWTHTAGVMRWVPAGLLILWVAVGGWRAADRMVRLRDEGRGDTAKVWVASPVVRWIDNQAPKGLPIYASDPALVYIQSTRAARRLPALGAGLSGFAQFFHEHPGAVVVTAPDNTEARVLALSDSLDLKAEVTAPEGTVLLPR